MLARRMAGGQATLKSHSCSSHEDHGTPADDRWRSTPRIIRFKREALATPKGFSPRICSDAWLAVGTGVLSRNAIESPKPHDLAADRARDAPLRVLLSRRLLRGHHHSRIMLRSYVQGVSLIPPRTLGGLTLARSVKGTTLPSSRSCVLVPAASSHVWRSHGERVGGDARTDDHTSGT